MLAEVAHEGHHLLPAHAGMIQLRGPDGVRTMSAPRARGDDPELGACPPQHLSCSPRTRG